MIIQKHVKVYTSFYLNLYTESESFKFKSILLGNTNNIAIIKLELVALLKHLSNFGKTLEMALINCEINLILTWSTNCIISQMNRVTTFTITDTKLKIMQNYYNNWNQVLEKQLIGITINQSNNGKKKSIFQLLKGTLMQIWKSPYMFVFM